MNTAWFVSFLVPLVARICIVGMFPFSGVDKIIHWKDALAQAESSILPGGPVLLIVAIAVEFVTPVCIVLHWHDQVAAFILAGFCVVTAFLYHPFWKSTDFWIKSGHSVGRSDFWDFLKNFGLTGGLILIMFGLVGG